MQLTYVRLLVDDYEACFRFYRDVMGFGVTFGDESGPFELNNPIPAAG